jgi:formiminoglutamase
MRVFDSGWLRPPDYGPAPAWHDPDFKRASEWLASNTSDEPAAHVLGVPFSSLSLSGARCDLLPSAVRQSLSSFSTYAPKWDADLESIEVKDLGDLVLMDDADASLARVRSAANLMGSIGVAIFVGGDNSITAPAMLGALGADAGLVTLDAHHDLRDYKRDGLSNGSPIRVLLDEGLKGNRIWQIGIKDFANSETYSALALKEGINVVRSGEVKRRGIAPVFENALSSLDSLPAVYVDFDVDVVERALAPAAPGAQPGGLQPSDLMAAAFLAGKHPSVMAIDIVEVDPERDVADATVRLAALILLAFAAGLTKRLQ